MYNKMIKGNYLQINRRIYMIAGLVGKIHLDGRLANEEEMTSLKECLFVPNGYQVEAMAFGSLAVASAAQTRNGCENKDNVILNNENCIIVGSGSIYNKEELISSLKITESCTELELICNGWMKIGNDIVKYLNGDWMFVAYDIDLPGEIGQKIHGSFKDADEDEVLAGIIACDLLTQFGYAFFQVFPAENDVFIFLEVHYDAPLLRLKRSTSEKKSFL
jgi:hypothetical protein